MPGLVNLSRYYISNKTKNAKEIIIWLYMGKDSFVQRKLLIAKITTTQGNCFLFEIERKIGRTSQESESFKGLVVKQNDDFLNQLPGLMTEIVSSRGVFDKCITNLPDAATFKHVSVEDGDMEKAISNGLKKIGFLLQV